MKLDMKTSLVALAACAALAAVFLPREPSRPAELAVPAGDSPPAASAPARTGERPSAGTLPEPERAMLAEIQRNFEPEEMESVFNPPTFDERQRMTSGPVDHMADAARIFDRDWAAFVDGLGLSARDARFVRNAWIEARALDTELAYVRGDGSHEDSAILAAMGEARNELYSRLSQVLTPGQMTAFIDYRNQLTMDGVASIQADLDQMIANGYHGIIRAADDGDLAAVQAHLATGADPNRFTADGNSAMREAARDNRTDILQALIDAGGDVNLPNNKGRNLLNDAALYGSADAARVLLDAGADPNQRIDPGNPLSVALDTAARNGHTETVRVLLDAGADATGAVGEFALASAIGFRDGEMEQMLLEAGANADSPRADESRILISLGRRLGLVD